MTARTLHDGFRKFAQRVSCAIGTPHAFAIAIAAVVVWAATGPAFHYSDSWQLVINTGTTIVTFLVVFAIQNTQNRDAKALHLKLDELLRAIGPARNGLVDCEDLDDEALSRYAREFARIRASQHSATTSRETSQVRK